MQAFHETVRTNLRRAHLARSRRHGTVLERGVRATPEFFQRITTRNYDQGITTIVSADHDFAATDTVATRLRTTWGPFLAEHGAKDADFPVTIPREHQLPASVGQALTAPVSEAEIATVIAGLARGKRAGPDELSNDFYHDHGLLLAPALERVYPSILDGAPCPPSFAEALIFPIRKNGDSDNPKDYRPISLLNSSYKIFARLLARRLAPGLDTVVSDVQNGFVYGRRMEHSVNTMLAALRLQEYEDP